MTDPHRHRVQIYYEDTDHSGFVYHANYLKYFERAREHLLDPGELVRLLNEDGIGFVVYKATLTYRRAASFGNILEVRTSVRMQSEYRLVFQQDVHLVGDDGQSDDDPMVKGELDLVCIDRDTQLVPVPQSVLTRVTS
jgi:tol-pal system-associated acyl-CoA thioesterase